MPSVLITGANRGIGLEFTRQYADAGWRVHAACRQPADAGDLDALARQYAEVSVHRLDVTDTETVRLLAQALGDQSFDLLINNAGTFGQPDRAGFGSWDYDDWLRVLDTNVLGPVRMAEAFLPHLKAGAQRRLVTVSSRVGAINEDISGGMIAYRSSKAGVNMAMRTLATDLKGDGIHVICFHPGWVRTRMGGGSAALSVEESVSRMIRTLADLPAEATDLFLDIHGARLAW